MSPVVFDHILHYQMNYPIVMKNCGIAILKTGFSEALKHAAGGIPLF